MSDQTAKRGEFCSCGALWLVDPKRSIKSALSSVRGTGEVTNVQVIRGLSHGLNERAIEAAKRITFVPAESNGKKISYRMTLEYNFNLY